MPGYIKCPKCYKSIREGIPFCPHCGEKQVDKRAKDEFGKDPYYVLQVSHHAEPEVIEAAYKRLAKKYHPDYNKSPEAQERIKELNWAYAILGNKERREEYDKVKGEKTRQQSEEYKPRHKEKPRPSPPPKKSTPSPTTSYKKQDKSTNKLGLIFVTVLIGMMGLCIFVPLISSTNNSTGASSNSTNKTVAKSIPTKQKIPTQVAAQSTKPIITTKPKPTTTPKPFIGRIVMALEDPEFGKAAWMTNRNSFTAGVKEVYAVFDYSGMSPDMRLTTIWYRNDYEVTTVSDIWRGGEEGTVSASLSEYTYGLSSGNYEVRIYIDNIFMQNAKFIIESSYDQNDFEQLEAKQRREQKEEGVVEWSR